MPPSKYPPERMLYKISRFLEQQMNKGRRFTFDFFDLLFQKPFCVNQQKKKFSF